MKRSYEVTEVWKVDKGGEIINKKEKKREREKGKKERNKKWMKERDKCYITRSYVSEYIDPTLRNRIENSCSLNLQEWNIEETY